MKEEIKNNKITLEYSLRNNGAIRLPYVRVLRFSIIFYNCLSMNIFTFIFINTMNYIANKKNNNNLPRAKMSPRTTVVSVY